MQNMPFFDPSLQVPQMPTQVRPGPKLIVLDLSLEALNSLGSSSSSAEAWAEYVGNKVCLPCHSRSVGIFLLCRRKHQQQTGVCCTAASWRYSHGSLPSLMGGWLCNAVHQTVFLIVHDDGFLSLGAPKARRARLLRTVSQAWSLSRTAFRKTGVLCTTSRTVMPYFRQINSLRCRHSSHQPTPDPAGAHHFA